MFTSIRFAAVAFAFALAGPAVGATGDVQVQTAPGEAAATVIVKGSGTIKAIDAKTRTVTILGDGGKEVEFVAGPEVKNFAQLAVGQRVNTEYMKGLTLELKPGSTAPISRTVEPFGDTGKKGQLPAGVVGQRIRVVGEVTSVNPETKTVMLKTPERNVLLELNDPAQVALIKVGDRVEAMYIEATAISVSAAK